MVFEYVSHEGDIRVDKVVFSKNEKEIFSCEFQMEILDPMQVAISYETVSLGRGFSRSEAYLQAIENLGR